jgi:hypothetical protein
MAKKKNGSNATKNGSGATAKGEAAAGKSVAAAGLPGAGAGGSPATGMTKWEAVKRALATLGQDAKPLAIQSHVRDKYKIQMTAGHVSTYKKKLAKKAAASTLTPRKAAPAPSHAPANGRAAASRPPAPTAVAPPADRVPGPKGDVVRIQDVLLTKDLLDRVGAHRLRVLIDALAK